MNSSAARPTPNQFFTAPNGNRTVIWHVASYGHTITRVDCLILAPGPAPDILGEISYTLAGWLAAKARAERVVPQMAPSFFQEYRWLVAGGLPYTRAAQI